MRMESLGFDTPPQKAWRLLNRRSLHWPEHLLEMLNLSANQVRL